MIKITSTKQKNKSLDKRYVTIPGIIIDRTELSDIAKIVFGMIHAFDREWNSISVKYMSEATNLGTTTIQAALRELKQANLIDWYYRAKHRSFKSLLEKDNDARAIIPIEVLNSDLGTTYKVSFGLLVAAGLNKLGAYNFNEISDLAMHLGLSISSVYRHINVLTAFDLIERDQSSTYMFYTLDRYSKNYRTAQRRKAFNKKLKHERERAEHVDIDPATEQALEQLYNRL